MAQITLNSSGVASSGSLLLQTNGTTTQATVDTSGNFGLGVTPSSWTTTWRALQLNNGVSLVAYKGGSEPIAALVSNTFSDGTWKYVNSQPAARYFQDQGVHKWDIAASGTAGNAITFTQAMTLDASGNLGIGTTSPSQKLHVEASTSATIRLVATGTQTGHITSDSSGFTFNSLSTAPVIFSTANTERARIDSSGNLLVGTTTGAEKLRLYGDFNANWGMGMRSTAGATTSNFIQFVVSAGGSPTQVGSITSNGTTTTYGTSSDYRLKENVAPMTGALEKVAALKPVTYTWKSTGETDEGFIAHELAEVCPQAVTGEKDAVDEDGSIKPQSIDTSFLVATLTAAIQELKAIVDAQAAEIAALKGQA